jgi:hypothetical protein
LYHIFLGMLAIYIKNQLEKISIPKSKQNARKGQIIDENLFYSFFVFSITFLIQITISVLENCPNDLSDKLPANKLTVSSEEGSLTKRPPTKRPSYVLTSTKPNLRNFCFTMSTVTFRSRWKVQGFYVHLSSVWL